jgi:hypothetical protein
MEFKTIKEEKTDKYYLFLTYDITNKEYLFECYLKVDGGLKHTVQRTRKKPKTEEILNCTNSMDYISPRPYKLAQPCDGSIGSPVISLFVDFCKKKNLNAFELLKKAYPDETFELEINDKLGKWEGVELPDNWNKREFDGLLESLTEINYHSLVGILAEIKMTIFEK